jgi:hypothetical protein
MTADRLLARPPLRYCAVCLTQFQPHHQGHRACERCYAWHRVGCYIELLGRQLDELH